MAFVANMQRAFRARRDENLARRAGTGRNTTKRLFSISLKPFGVRTNRVLDEDKQRPELLAVTEDAAAAESPAPPAESPPPPAESPAPLIDLSEPLPPLESAPPLSSAFEAQPPPPQPPAEESLADGDAEGAAIPSPFRRKSKIMRTPSGRESEDRPEDRPPLPEGEEEAPAPLPLNWSAGSNRASVAGVESSPAPEVESEFETEIAMGAAPNAAQSDAPDVEVGSAIENTSAVMPPPPAVQRSSFGCSPMEGGVAGVARDRVSMHSMGCSPIGFEATPGAAPVERHSFGCSPMEDPSASFASEAADHSASMDDGFGGDDGDEGGVGADAAPPPEEEEEEEVPLAQRVQRATNRKPRKSEASNIGRMPEPPPSVDENGARKGLRKRFRPLEYWRNERVVYGRRASAKFEAIVDVQTQPREQTPPHFRKRKEKLAESAKIG